MNYTERYFFQELRVIKLLSTKANDLLRLPLITLFEYTMTSSNGNIFRVTGHLCAEFTSHR